MVSEGRTDSELLREAREDPAAFLAFYDRYETAVVCYLKRSVRDPEVVADLTAEVFAKALSAASRYRPARPTAAGWLLTIARNTLLHSVRKKKVEARGRRRVGIRDAVGFEDDELDRVESIDSENWLVGLLDHLPPAQAEAIRARVLDDRTYPEIAAELETSELVIRKRVSRGLATLRQVLEEENRS